MTSTITDRVYGESASVAVKAPCLSVSVGPLPLSGLGNVGSYSPNPGDRILVKDQSDPTANGIYNASTGAWARSGDFDGIYDAVQGTLIVAYLPNGTSILYQLTTENPIIGTTPLIFFAYISPFAQQFPITQAEINQGVTPTNYFYPPGNILRFGADPLGVADSTAAVNDALLTSTRVYVPGGTYACSASLNMTSGQTLFGDGAASVLAFANGALNNIVMQTLVNSTVRDLKINITGTQGLTKLGAVFLSLCIACHVERVEIVGHNWSGVWLDQSSNCFIRNNYIHGAPALLNTTNAGGDIMLWTQSATGNSNYNVIDGNQCFGGNTAFGIMLIDPDSATSTNGYPLRNVVSNNRIGAHTTYGISLYMPGAATTAADTFNQIVNNWIENITGLSSTGFSLSPNISSGAGIYAVGKGIGGTVISGNTISNCCISTLIRNLAPAAIGINGSQTGLTRPIIANNAIDGMTQGDGILVTSSPGGAIVIGNSINMPSTNTGSGPGAGLLGAGIRVEASSDVEIGPNQVLVFGAGQGLYLFANGVNATRLGATGGNYTTNGTGPALQIGQNGGFSITQLAITGTRFTANGGSADTLSINAIAVGHFSNVIAACTTQRALFLNGCTSMRFSGGEYTSTGAVNVATSGVCTNSFITRDTNIGAGAASINNAGTGCRIEWFGTAAPAAGTWAVGDTVYNTSPSAAGVFLWVTTTAGAGTWKTVSNT